MKLKTIILSAIAVIGMATPAFAKDKAPKNTDNNVSSDTELVAVMKKVCHLDTEQ